MDSDQDLYNKLSMYTLEHTDPSFIHQHAVDAFTAQHANEDTKPISLAFALVGLYLLIEKNYSGKEVQEAHMQMAKKPKNWPTFTYPQHRGDITIKEVMQTEAGKQRDEMIYEWAHSVWGAWSDSHEKVAVWVQSENLPVLKESILENADN